MKTWEKLLPKLNQWKYPILILLIGIILMTVPGSSQYQSIEENLDQNTLLCQILSCSDGVGEARVIVSESGVVVVCEGAENARVRLDIIRAIGSYTGFGADRITVLKMVKQ